MGKIITGIDEIEVASQSFVDFSERLRQLISAIDAEIDVISSEAATGDAVVSMVDKYSEIKSVSLQYSQKIAQVGELLSTTAKNRKNIDMAGI